GICFRDPVLPLDQSSPNGTGTNPEHGRGSIEAGRRRAKRDSNSLHAQNTARAHSTRSDSAMKRTNKAPSIQCLLSLPRERNRNREEPIKGQARWRGSLRSPLTEPSQFQTTPQLWKRKKKSEVSVVMPPSSQRSQQVSSISAL